MYLFNLPNVDVSRSGLRGFSQLPYINVWGTVWNAHEWTQEEPSSTFLVGLERGWGDFVPGASIEPIDNADE